MTEHSTRPRHPSVKEVEVALSDLDFPLDKQDLMRCVAEKLGEPDHPVVRQLRALPLGTYGSASDVLKSVDVVDVSGP